MCVLLFFLRNCNFLNSDKEKCVALEGAKFHPLFSTILYSPSRLIALTLSIFLFLIDSIQKRRRKTYHRGFCFFFLNVLLREFGKSGNKVVLLSDACCRLAFFHSLNLVVFLSFLLFLVFSSSRYNKLYVIYIYICMYVYAYV